MYIILYTNTHTQTHTNTHTQHMHISMPIISCLYIFEGVLICVYVQYVIIVAGGGNRNNDTGHTLCGSQV